MNEQPNRVWTHTPNDSNDSTDGYLDGERCGQWEVRWRDGATAQGTLVDGKPFGEWEFHLVVAGEEKTLCPIYIDGPWESGIALGMHIVRSVAIGENEFGHMQFDNTYSEVGQLMHNFKSKQNDEAGRELALFALAILKKHRAQFDVVAAVPSSTEKTVTARLAQWLSDDLGVVDGSNEITTSNHRQVKNIHLDERKTVLAKATKVTPKAFRGQRVLVVDDMLDSGATLATVVEAVQTVGQATKVSVLACTKTKNRGTLAKGAEFTDNTTHQVAQPDDDDFDDEIPF